jgi:predicted nucleic acid-binding protein
MPKLRIYLDTSVINHLFHDDAPERQAATWELFENAIGPKAYDAFISSVVVDEIRRTPDPGRRSQLLDVIGQYELSILPDGGDEVDRLAQLYVQRGIIPVKEPEDALHVAYATLFEIDVLVTWNFRHLAKAKNVPLIQAVNLVEGYNRPLRLVTPLEVLEP